MTAEIIEQAVGQLRWFVVQPRDWEGDLGPTVHLGVFQENAIGDSFLDALTARVARHFAAREPVVIAGFSYVLRKSSETPELMYYLRGLNGFDVKAFAEANGGCASAPGKAHFEASLATLSLNPYGMIRSLLLEYLEKSAVKETP